MSSARSTTIAANRSSRLGPDVAAKPEHPASDPRLPSRETAPGRATAPLPSHPDLGDELRELRVGEPVLFDRQGLDMPIMDRPLVWVELLRAHFEDSIEQLDQVRQRATQRTLAVAHLDGWRGCAEHHPQVCRPI